MLEKVKSAFLFVLVLNSLILSGILWFKQTGFTEGDSLTNNEKIEQMGNALQLSDILQPSKVIFHHGNGNHSCALPKSAVYQSVKKDMRHWDFTEFSSIQLNDEQWNELLQQRKGMEVLFPLPASVEFIPSLFGAMGLSNYVKEIDRIWIYVHPTTNATHALFLSHNEKKVILASTNITLNNMNKYFFSFEKDWNLPLYDTIERITEKKGNQVYKEIFYVPREQYQLAQYKYFYINLTPQQGVKALFSDPGVTHQVVEKDGTLYYTDGIRVLKIPPSLRYFDYYAPDGIQEENVEGNQLTFLQNVLSFINDHGGFPGDYGLEKMGKDNYVFRERVDTYPLYGESGIHQIYVRSGSGKVIAYRRPLIYLDTYFEKESVTIQSSSEIKETLKKNHWDQKLKGIELGYQTEIKNGYLEMVPVWVIHQEGSSSPILIEAAVPEDGNEGGQ
jgi:regulatory protein YycH of two-component signal transduction system YycFG